MEVNKTKKFEKIYETEGDAIFRFSILRVGSREQALDITQETFLRLWTTLQQDEEIANTRAFLFTVCHRLIIDWYRKKKSLSLESVMNTVGKEGGREDQYEPADESTQSDSNTVLGAEGRFLVEKIRELGSGLRSPVYLRFVEGLTPPEIGEILNISANAASVRINRGLEELRKKTGYNNGAK